MKQQRTLAAALLATEGQEGAEEPVSVCSPAERYGVYVRSICKPCAVPYHLEEGWQI